MIKNLSIFLFLAINVLLPLNTFQLKADDLDRLLNEGREKYIEKNYNEALNKFDKQSFFKNSLIKVKRF